MPPEQTQKSIIATPSIPAALPKAPELLFSEIRTTPQTFRYANWIIIAVELENTTDKPVPCKIWVEEAKLWSDKQKRFVGRSSLSSIIELAAPPVLEPDVPATVRMLGSIRKPSGEPAAVFVESPKGRRRIEQDGIYIFTLKIESQERYKTMEVFVKWKKGKSFELIDDPRRHVSGN